MWRSVAHCKRPLALLCQLHHPHLKLSNPYHPSSSNLVLFFGSSSSSSSSSRSGGARNYHLRKTRNWPLSPYKAKWQETFNHQQAIETLKQSTKTSPNLLTTLIDSFSVYNCDPTPNAYHFIIKTLAQTSKLDQIPPILHRIENVEKFETPEFVLVDLIKLYGRANLIRPAIDLFFRIPKFRCVPSVDSLNCLLLVLCRNREGIRVVPQILLKSQLMNIRVEGSCFCVLIEGLCRIRKVNYAIKLLNFMISDGYSLDGRLCSLIIATLCEDGNDLSWSSVEVMGFWDAMRRLGFSPGRVDWCNVIRFFVKKGKGMDALDVLEQMKTGGIKPDVVACTLVLDGVIAEGKFEKADRLFDEMLVLGLVPNIRTYNVYINGLRKQNKVEEGVVMLACMEELGCNPNVVTYNVLLKGLCKAGKLSRAREIVKEMRAKGVQLDSHTYGILIGGLVKVGEIDEVCLMVKEILDKGFPLPSSTFDDVICGLCQRGLFGKALELLKESVGENFAPGIRSWEALLIGSELNCGFEDNGLVDAETPFQTDILGRPELIVSSGLDGEEGHMKHLLIYIMKHVLISCFVLMEHLKGQLKDVSVIPGLAESSSFLDGCNFLNSKLSDTFSTMDIEELRAYVGTDQRKRLAEIFGEDGAHDQKKKSHV
ncbi:hypothetical protein RHGRI_010831 [Rhododendron griersonianum]|uniref:Pentatricopeptide repeat-containing protein n=1 Tax=Rhododendron griersonianum TaxID=479676 RepID=A0AAV6KJQ4_9ERIC|nr:hypothetical protein RHGRI_010831 [Rhododendron griersonianum]